MLRYLRRHLRGQSRRHQERRRALKAPREGSSRQSDLCWKCFNGNSVVTSERRSGAHVGLCEARGLELNRTRCSYAEAGSDYFVRLLELTEKAL